jgi:hypothetical protein
MVADTANAFGATRFPRGSRHSWSSHTTAKVTGLYDARLDHMPVLAIAGQQVIRATRREGSVITNTARQVLSSLRTGA